jgi:hypothetical protein
MAGDWTVILVVKANGDGALWSFANSANRYRWHRLISALGGKTVRIGSNNATSESLSETVENNATAPTCAALKNFGGQLSLKRLDTGVSATLASANPAGTVPRLGLGCAADSAVYAIVSASTFYSHLFYNRALSNAEIQRIYRSLKATWAARGVTIL